MNEYVTMHTGFKQYVVNNLVIVHKACLTFLVFLLVLCTYKTNYVDNKKFQSKQHIKLILEYVLPMLYDIAPTIYLINIELYVRFGSLTKNYYYATRSSFEQLNYGIRSVPFIWNRPTLQEGKSMLCLYIGIWNKGFTQTIYGHYSC